MSDELVWATAGDKERFRAVCGAANDKSAPVVYPNEVPIVVLSVIYRYNIIGFIIKLIVLGALLHHRRNTLSWVCYSSFQRSVVLVTRSRAVTISSRTCALSALVTANMELYSWATSNNEQRVAMNSAKVHSSHDNQWLLLYQR